MTRKRLAPLALAVFAAGVLGLLAIPAWGAAGTNAGLTAVTGETTTTKSCEPGHSYSDRCKTNTRTETKTKTKTETTTETKTETETKTKTTTVPVTVKSTSGTLPVTGSATTAVVVGGVALVLGGAVLLGWLHRRREE
jgi:LPXTG-motif cell wall-anchored protein